MAVRTERTPVPRGEASGTRTRARLLEVGERLFATIGIDGAPTRRICREAGVNQDAIHYHFGSKEGFVAAILEAGIGRLDEHLDKRLAEAEAAGGLTLRSLASAAVDSTSDLSAEGDLGAYYLPFLCSVLAHPGLHALATHRRSPWGERMSDALARLLPTLPPAERAFRLAIVAFILIHMVRPGPSSGAIAEWVSDAGSTSDEQLRTMVVESLIGVMGGPTSGTGWPAPVHGDGPVLGADGLVGDP